MKIKLYLFSIYTYLNFGSYIFANNNYYIWHWHLNYGFDQQSLSTLKSIPIKGLFLHSGNFSLIDKVPSFEGIQKRTNFVQQIKNLKTYFKEIHLCYTFGNNKNNPFVKGFLNKNPRKAIQYIVSKISQNYEFYQSLNKKIIGIQIDLEGSGIDFDIYKKIILKLKKVINPQLISITPMSSWIKKDKFKQLVKECNFVVPMLYDYFRGKSPKQNLKVTDYFWLKSMVKRYQQLDTKIVYGLPTYSYNVLYNDKGKMKVPWAVYNPNSITENKRFKLISSIYGLSKKKSMHDRVISYEAKDTFSFKSQSFKKHSIMKYNYISPSALAQYIEAIKSTVKTKDTNIAFFRFGKSSEELVLTAKKLKKAITYSFPAYFKISINKIYTPNGFYLSFRNLGSSSYFGKQGLTLNFSNTTIKDSNSDFDFFTKNSLTESYFQHNEVLISPKFKSNPSFKLTFIQENGVTIVKDININGDKLILKK
ncbi:MAG: hypothetical protein COB02_14290 [Candidatus Cloacimonadota bacterium]|nr:MAG: hypothetical protein COB02_14290 [Candidatus Cloacimonadota bacterium]